MELDAPYDGILQIVANDAGQFRVECVILVTESVFVGVEMEISESGRVESRLSQIDSLLAFQLEESSVRLIQGYFVTIRHVVSECLASSLNFLEPFRPDGLYHPISFIIWGFQGNNVMNSSKGE